MLKTMSTSNRNRLLCNCRLFPSNRRWIPSNCRWLPFKCPPIVCLNTELAAGWSEIVLILIKDKSCHESTASTVGNFLEYFEFFLEIFWNFLEFLDFQKIPKETDAAKKTNWPATAAPGALFAGGGPLRGIISVHHSSTVPDAGHVVDPSTDLPLKHSPETIAAHIRSVNASYPESCGIPYQLTVELRLPLGSGAQALALVDAPGPPPPAFGPAARPS